MRTKQMKKVVAFSIGGSPSGCQACFIALNEDWGLKLYYDEDKRDGCYELQKEAAALGLGPKVGGMLDLGEGASIFRYGYVTQRLAVLKVVLREAYFEEHGNLDYYCSWDAYSDWEIDNLSRTRKIRERLLEELGFEFQDDHSNNWGLDKEGNLFCIDFGSEDWITDNRPDRTSESESEE